MTTLCVGVIGLIIGLMVGIVTTINFFSDDIFGNDEDNYIEDDWRK